MKTWLPKVRSLFPQQSSQGKPETSDYDKSLYKEIKAARELLDFAISEGTRVDDGIIAAIIEIDEQLADPSVSAQGGVKVEQRRQFKTAYRNLVITLTPVTHESLRYSALPKWLLFLLSLGFFVLLLGVRWWIDASWQPVTLIILSVIFSILLWFLDIFTGIISKKRVVEIVFFCYLFTVLAVIGSMMPFFLVDFNNFNPNSPISIVRGCNKQVDPTWVANELKCDENNGSTLGSIGQWVVNIGGITQAPQAGQPEVSVIHGGLVVPLYVIVLSLIGGAISMTRRVPEYQKRIYLPEGMEGHLPKEAARELLVLQIMQVFSAPLIAFTTYYIVTPPNPATSVVVGFAAGFASETVLRSIRALVDKLNPGEAPHASSLSTFAPTVQGVQPYQEEAGQTVESLQIVGTGFQFEAIVYLVQRTAEKEKILAEEVHFVQSTKLTCKVILSSTAHKGKWDVVVVNPNQQTGVLSDGFNIT